MAVETDQGLTETILDGLRVSPQNFNFSEKFIDPKIFATIHEDEQFANF